MFELSFNNDIFNKGTKKLTSSLFILKLIISSEISKIVEELFLVKRFFKRKFKKLH